MINTFLFDLDGTLTDPKIGITKSVQYALESFDIIIKDLDDLLCFIGPPLRQSFKDFYGFNDENIEKAVEKYREYFIPKGIYENTMYAGIDTVLKELSDTGKTLMIATSKPTILAKTVLSHFDLEKYFVFISGSEMDGVRSDKSEVIQYAVEQNNITDLSGCIMIGDRKHDIIGAKTVGIKSIGVLYGYGDYDEMAKAGADYIIKDVTELSALLDSL